MAEFFFPDLVPGRAVDQDQKTIFDPETDSKYSNYESVMSKWLLGAYEEAKFDAEQDDDVKKQNFYIQYLLGNQWPSKRASHRSNAVDNRTWRLTQELIALLTDLRPVGEVKSTFPNQFLDAEKMLNSATKAWWLESDSDLDLAMLIVYAILGTGFVKFQWNPELRAGRGDLELLPTSPMNCLCLKPTDIDLQSSQAIIYEAVWPLWKFRQRFGTRGAMVKPDLSLSKYRVPGAPPSHMSPSGFSQLPVQLQRLVGTPAKDVASSYPMAKYREFWFRDPTVNPSNKRVLVGEPGTNWSYWVEPGQPLYPRGRMIPMGGDKVILRDGPNTYWHGLFPFDVLRLNIVPWSFFGVSDLRPQVPLQDIINNILAGVIDLIKKAVSPQLIGPKTSLSETQWTSLDTSKPGAKIATNPISSQMPQYSQPPNLPAWVMTTLAVIGREMEQSSGVAAISQAMQKRQVPSGETLEEIKDVQQTPIRLKGRNIEVLLRNLGTMNISNIYQFYSEDRRMFLSGKKLGPGGMPELQHFDWIRDKAVPRLNGNAEPAFKDPAEYARQFIFRIHPGSLLNINHVEKTMTIMRLRMMKDIDRKTMYEVLDLGINVNDVETNLREEAMQQAKVMANQRMILMLQQAFPGLAAGQGGGQPPPVAPPAEGAGAQA